MPLAPVEWTCVAFAIVVAHLFLYHEWNYPSAYDATTYVDIARDIAEGGLFRNFSWSDRRTYAYPFVLSLVVRAHSETGVPLLVLVFLLQLFAFLAAALCLRHTLVTAYPKAARIAFCGLLVNYYALIYIPQSLSESLSLTLLVAPAAAWVLLKRDGLSTSPLIAGSLLVGFAVMVRPANAFMVAAWVFGVVLVGLRQRPPLSRAAIYAGLLLAAVALPMTPQIRNNVVHHGTETPFVANDLGLLQQTLGVQNLKYATAMPPVRQAPIYYNNPLWVGTNLSETAPWTWYFAYPLRGAATLALHVFGMTDQDLLFTYSRDLHPWYRVPLGIVNHGLVALGVIGFVLLGRSVRTAKAAASHDAYFVLLALLAGNLAAYAWTDVEMRFGSVLLLILVPLAIYTATHLYETRRTGTRVAMVVVAAAYVAFALPLSGWIRDQSAQIREAYVTPNGPLAVER